MEAPDLEIKVYKMALGSVFSPAPMTWWQLTTVPWAGGGLQSWLRMEWASGQLTLEWSQLLQCPWLWAVGGMVVASIRVQQPG